MPYVKPPRHPPRKHPKQNSSVKRLRNHVSLKRVACHPTRNRLRHLKYFPCAVPHDQPDDDRRSCLGLPLSLPYEVESLADMDARLELILCRLTECVKAHEWFTGFNTWNSALNM